MTHNTTPRTFFDVETWYEGQEKTIAFVLLQGIGSRVLNSVSDMRYEIVSGEGAFKVGNETMTVSAGSIIEIPRGTTYQDSGDLAMLATSVPPFDPESVTVYPE